MSVNPTPVVILCGGMGTRLREETEHKPKPLVRIGGMPVLWHIMKHYGLYGYREFILCLGYKGHLIKEFFLDYAWRANDITLDFATGNRTLHHQHPPDDWRITFAETGNDTPTGGRVAKIRKYVASDKFCVTYGDGLSNIDLDDLAAFHRDHGKVGTLTAIHPMSPFGVIEAKDGMARSFKEKPRLEGLVNGGFFVFSKRVFDYLREDSVLEEEPVRKLCAEGQLGVYEHHDFWMCMDTFKDVERLNRMWDDGERPWVGWK